MTKPNLYERKKKHFLLKRKDRELKFVMKKIQTNIQGGKIEYHLKFNLFFIFKIS